jgi:dTDP-4-dehydrorhamnose reductase
MSDLRGLSLILQREKFDVLVICSGFTWVDGCEKKPARARLQNAILPGKIAQLCRRHKTKVVYLSSSYVFDGERGPYSERDRPNPLSIYGKSKLEGEQKVRQEGGKRALIIRTMGVVGYEPQEKNFLYTVIRNLQKTKFLVVPNDQRGNITCATDLAQGICLLLEKNKRGIYHIAGRRPNAKRSEVAKQIAKNYRLDAKLIHPEPTVELTSKAPRPRYGGLLTEKARKQVGWRPLSLLPELAKIACA